MRQSDRRQRFPAGNAQLRSDKVDTGHFLGHGVLDLETRVGLDEGQVRLVVGIDQELERAQAAVVIRRCQANGCGGQTLAGLIRDRRARRPLDDLLMPPLQTALTFAEVGNRAGAVTYNLHFNVTRGGHQALDQQIAVAECRGSLRLATLVRLGDLILGRHHSHAPAAAARYRLEHHRAAVAQRVEELSRPFEFHSGFGTWQHGNVQLDRQRASAGLVAEQLE